VSVVISVVGCQCHQWSVSLLVLSISVVVGVIVGVVLVGIVVGCLLVVLVLSVGGVCW